MPDMSWKGVIFDLDGTLLDTREDIADAMNRVLADLGFPTHPYDSYNYYVGDGAATLVRRALPPEKQDDATLRECLARFLADYGVNWNIKTKPYNGIAEMLSGLQDLGTKLAVLTNKPAPTAARCVEEYLPRWRFDAVLGQTDGLPKKPDPTGALQIAEQLALGPAEILYLGDTATDMETAIRAGMYPVGALWGFRPRRELLESGARALVQVPGDLLTLFCGKTDRT
jgi:phosphoglycolate phosphatase